MENLCGVHHNARMRRDDEYRARFDAWLTNVQAQDNAQRARMEHRMAAERVAREQRIAAERAAREQHLAAERAAEEARRNEIRTRRETERTNYLTNIENLSIRKISSFYEHAMALWRDAPIQGYDVPKAYAVLRYRSTRHEGFVPVLRGIIKLVYQGPHQNPDYQTYSAIPAAERAAVLEEITTALAAYGDINLSTTLDPRDRWSETIRLRQRREEEERQRAEAEARRARERAEMQRNLRERPVVFQRDPEGSINLAAFATDAQSVHRSSVQSATHRAVLTLLSRPLGEGQDTLPEIIEGFQAVRWFGSRAQERSVMELTNDYFNTEAFSVRYGEVVDRVWAFIRSHVHKADLTLRLAQETAEGIGMCSNGKMARLINVLQGYDETLEAEKPKELFQAAIALLMNRPFSEREAAARNLFSEYNIPEAEHAVWLEPLLEVEA